GGGGGGWVPGPRSRRARRSVTALDDGRLDRSLGPHRPPRRVPRGARRGPCAILLLLGGRRAADAEEAEEPAAPRAAHEAVGVVVEGRVVHQLAERPLAAVELGGDGCQVGDRLVEGAEEAARGGLLVDQPADDA